MVSFSGKFGSVVMAVDTSQSMFCSLGECVFEQ